jgi:hypothetical protein
MDGVELISKLSGFVALAFARPLTTQTPKTAMIRVFDIAFMLISLMVNVE